MLRNNILSTAVDYNYGAADSYYYHLEQQRALVDDMHFRVTSGGYPGYYYNPHYAYDYGYGYPGYGYAHHGAHGSVEQTTTVKQDYGNHGHVYAPIAVETTEAADELSAGEIAGIVIGSVVGFLLLLFLLCIAMNSMGRSKRAPQMAHYPPPYYNTNASDVTGTMSDAPDIMDMSGKKPAQKPM